MARHRQVTIVFHDPKPLKATPGFGRTASAIGRLASHARHLEVVTHSVAAAEELRKKGWRVNLVLPHPILPLRDVESPPTSKRLLVVGQYKPVRDLALLADLGPVLAAHGFELIIAGRGWPDIPGWTVHSRFLSERDIDYLIRLASCVLVPYQRFYQSGIAVRALEAGRPIVGPAHAFLAELYGSEWPGLITDQTREAWVRGIDDAISTLMESLQQLNTDYVAAVRKCWSRYFEDHIVLM